MREDNYKHITDQELLEKFYQSGDNFFLGILLQRYTMLLLGVCMKYLKNEEEAKDAVQQIFLKVITELPKYKVEYFKSWLYMVAKNYCLMQLRNKPEKFFSELTDKAADPDAHTINNEQMEKDLLYNNMEAAMEELSEEQKTCLILFYFEKKSYHEICDQTGFSLLQVKSYLQNGKRNLKLLMEKKMNN